MLYLALIVMAIFALLALVYKLERQGRKAESEETMDELLGDIYVAHIIRDNINNSTDYADRVRKRFTRKI